MELTFTDAAWHDLGTIEPYDGDFAWGNAENDFSVNVSSDIVPEVGSLLYVEGSDIGGLVTGYESRADTGTFTIVGDTWTGVINRKVLEPDAGQVYYSVQGDVRNCFATVIKRLGLGSLFVVDGVRTGLSVSHTFTGSRSAAQKETGRYMGGWSALWQLLYDHGCKCRMRWDDEQRKVVCTILRRRDYTDEESLDIGIAEVGISRRLPTNHLVCLGKGEGVEREVLHLYADAQGNVSTKQTYTGLSEIASIYDINNDEGERLVADGTKKLQELWADSQEVTVASDATSTVFELGDVIGGTDYKSGLTASAVVTKKVASFKQGRLTWSYTSVVRS